MTKFWERIRSFANKKIKEQHAHSRKCERCKLWTSEVGGASRVYDVDEWTQAMVCNHCGHTSFWDMSGMIPMLIANKNLREI